MKGGKRSARAAAPEEIARLIAAWFASSARDLPWRAAGTETQRGAWGYPERLTPRRNPYFSLVSEAMLQQTQVSRVLGKFERFVERFPTVRSLAEASEADVLAMWTGLGYYRRAKNLHVAARLIVAEFDGRVPAEAALLRRLPGVGRYTAGAIASIAFDLPEAIVDGNVARVLMRVHGIDGASDDKDVLESVWKIAGELASAGCSSPGTVNEGLMELGATVCVPAPAAPMCDRCPLRERCVARSLNRQGDIPKPKSRGTRRTIYCCVALLHRADGSVLLEQRPSSGMWGGMWQAVTIDREDRHATVAELAIRVGCKTTALARAESFEFLATHRKLMFRVFRGKAPEDMTPARGRFVPIHEAVRLAMSSPQLTILNRTTA